MDRTYITLNENWKFHYGEVPQAWYKGYDDSAWTSVTLPHDWSVHMPFEQTNSSGTGYLSGGIGWYRVRFSLPEESSFSPRQRRNSSRSTAAARCFCSSVK